VSKTNLPSVTSNIPNDLRYFIDRLREKLNETGTGRFVTVKELKDGGVINTTPNGDPTPPDDGNDTTLIPVLRPPAPEGLTATAGYEFVTLTWNTPSYYGHQYAEVYRTDGSLFDPEQEQFIATVAGFSSVFSDYVGTGQEFTYRVRFVNINNVEGDFSEPVTAKTAIDVEEVLEVLTGNISDTQLNTELAGSLFGEDGLQGKITEVRDDVNGLYVLKVAADGKVAGFGLSVEEGEAFFAAQADRFWLSPPPDYVLNRNPNNSEGANGQVWYNSTTKVYYLKEADTWRVFDSPFPFIVQTTPVTIDNVDVPPGVYINDGYIRNATITTAMIREAAIDTARIVDGAITNAKVGFLDAGKITTGTLKSHNFTNEAGRAGFLLTMGVDSVNFEPTLDEDGNLQFDADGNIVGVYQQWWNPFNQEDVTFILRSAFLNDPALELRNGRVTIHAGAIRKSLESVSYAFADRFGFKFDIDNGTVDIRDGSGDSVFKIEDGNSKGIVKMTGAAIRDYFQSYGFNYQVPGFRFDTGYTLDGNFTDPSFYLYGNNSELLIGVDANGTQLSGRIDASLSAQAIIRGSEIPNPLMFERDYKFGTPKPKGWFVSGTYNHEHLTYGDENYNSLLIDSRVPNPDFAGFSLTDSTLEVSSTAFKVDPTVKTYRIKLRWRMRRGSTLSGGVRFRVTTAADLTGSKCAISTNSTTPHDEVVKVASALINTKSLYTVSDTNTAAEGDLYNDKRVRALYTWFDTVLEWRNPTEGYASFNIGTDSGLGSDYELEFDYITVEPHEYKADSIIGPSDSRLSDSLFAWVQDRIDQNNIRTYLADAAIVSAVIGNAEIRTLNIDGNAVTVPEGFTQPVDETVSLGNMVPIGDWLYLPYWDSGLGPTALIINGQLQFMGDANQHQGTASIRVIAEWFTDSGTWSVADDYAKNNSFRSHSFQAQYGGQVSTMVHVPAPTSNGVFWSRGCRVRVEGTFLATDNKNDFRSITRVSLAVLGSKR
jgi:hypothetical protein